VDSVADIEAKELSAAPNPGRRSANVVRNLYSRPVSGIGATITLLFFLVALLGPWIAPYGASEIIAGDARQPPSVEHWFGTDNLGRDVFSRVSLGVREILVLSGLGTLLAVLGGTFLGLLAGYRGGWLDEGLMCLFARLIAMPAMLLPLL